MVTDGLMRALANSIAGIIVVFGLVLLAAAAFAAKWR
jgi:hypothetical protein